MAKKKKENKEEENTKEKKKSFLEILDGWKGVILFSIAVATCAAGAGYKLGTSLSDMDCYDKTATLKGQHQKELQSLHKSFIEIKTSVDENTFVTKEEFQKAKDDFNKYLEQNASK